MFKLLSLGFPVGCRKLDISENYSPLKVVHRAENPVQKEEQGFFFSPEKTDAGEYCYGFNGMEKDDEISGVGNNYTTYFRAYNSRLARWFSLDPKAQKYPEISPYVSFLNNPIFFTDPKGDDPPEATKTYNVSKGDNLTYIAAIHCVSVKDLVAWNADITEENQNIIHPNDVINVSNPNRFYKVHFRGNAFAGPETTFYDRSNPSEAWEVYSDSEGTEYWVDLNSITFEEWETICPYIVYDENKKEGLNLAKVAPGTLKQIGKVILKGKIGKEIREDLLKRINNSIKRMENTEYDPDNLPENLPPAPDDPSRKVKVKAEDVSSEESTTPN